MSSNRPSKISDEALGRLVRKQWAKPYPPITHDPARTNKYRAVKKWVDGHQFDSSGEAKRYAELSMLEKAGKIRHLVLQQRYSITVEGVHICDYVADFVYSEGGLEIIEDFKGMRTAVYELKKKLMLAVYGITIRETHAHR